jgi:hypothetical protein
MKSTSVQARLAKVVMAGVLAGAVFMAAPAKAEAQEIVVRAYAPHAAVVVPVDFRRREVVVRRDSGFRGRDFRRPGRVDRGYRGYR